MPADVGIAAEPFEGPDGVQLRVELGAELRARYGGGDALAGDRVDGASMLFLIARDTGGTAVGCAALRPSAGPGTFEIKRMFVRPSARGRGVGSALLLELERRAVSLGAARLILECGAEQPEAIALYTRHGYRPIPPFGAYASSPLSRCFGRELG